MYFQDSWFYLQLLYLQSDRMYVYSKASPNELNEASSRDGRKAALKQKTVQF